MWVSHSLFIPLNIPLCLFALTLCHSISLSHFLFLYLSIHLSLCFPSHFLIPPHSTHLSLPFCVIRKGLPDPVYINQLFLPASPVARGMHCVLWYNLCDIINLFLAQTSGLIGWSWGCGWGLGLPHVCRFNVCRTCGMVTAAAQVVGMVECLFFLLTAHYPNRNGKMFLPQSDVVEQINLHICLFL